MVGGVQGVPEVPGVRVRPWELTDVDAAHAAAMESVAEIQPWMPWCHPAYSIDDARAWVTSQIATFEQRTAFEFAIVSADGVFLGGCGLNQIDALNRRANLGYWVRTSASRRGVATAAVRAVRDWAFVDSGLLRLEIVIASGNVASHRVAEKAGAYREGVLKQRLLLHGALHDATMFSFTRPVAP